jgi:predicted TIM-barrel fold metal-dependent hydrolase
MIPLFDSLSHPSLSGDWFGRGLDASFPGLVRGLRAAGFSRACAVGVAGRENYEHAAFAAQCRAWPELVPIAGVEPQDADTIERELDTVHDLGFLGIKLHPRFSNFGYDDARLIPTFKAATRRKLAIFLCTYFHAPIERYPSNDPLYSVVEVMKAVPDTRLVLLHGGTVDLMRWMQFARHTPNILLDISLTLMCYRGSALDLDLAWLFDGFHNRTCLGTDHPEYSHADVRLRFEEIAARATPDAARKIGGLNLARFLGVDLD